MKSRFWTKEEPEWVVWLLVIIALAAGWVLKTNIQGQMEVFTDPQSALTVRYPATWMKESDPNSLLTVSDPHSPSAFKSTFTVQVREIKKEGEQPEYEETALARQANLWTLGKGQELPFFRVLETKPGNVAGKPAMLINYSYVADPLRATARSVTLPVVVKALDALVIHEGRVYIFTFAADQTAFTAELSLMEKLMASLSFG
ncbi:MAG: hypothetical protein ACUVV0_01975 [Anaerolineae bacterium]